MKNLAQFKTTQNKKLILLLLMIDIVIILINQGAIMKKKVNVIIAKILIAIEVLIHMNTKIMMVNANLVIVYLTIDKYKIIYYYLLFLLFKLYF